MQRYIFLDEYWNKKYIFSDDQRGKNYIFPDEWDAQTNKKEGLHFGVQTLFVHI